MVFLVMEDSLNIFLKFSACFSIQGFNIIMLCIVAEHLSYIETENRNLRMFVDNLFQQVLLIEIVYK